MFTREQALHDELAAIARAWCRWERFLARRAGEPLPPQLAGPVTWEAVENLRAGVAQRFPERWREFEAAGGALP